MPPLANILTCAGALAGVFVFAFAADPAPVEADTHVAQQARQELRRDLAAQQACPPGHAVLWIDPTTTECFKEIKP